MNHGVFLRHILTRLKSDTNKEEKQVGTSFHFTYGCIDSESYFFHTRATSASGEHFRLSSHLFQMK